MCRESSLTHTQNKQQEPAEGARAEHISDYWFFWWHEVNKIWCRAKNITKVFPQNRALSFCPVFFVTNGKIILPVNRKTGKDERGRRRERREKATEREGQLQPPRLERKGEHIPELASLRWGLQQPSCSFCKQLEMKGARSCRCIQRGLNSS